MLEIYAGHILDVNGVMQKYVESVYGLVGFVMVVPVDMHLDYVLVQCLSCMHDCV